MVAVELGQGDKLEPRKHKIASPNIPTFKKPIISHIGGFSSYALDVSAVVEIPVVQDS